MAVRPAHLPTHRERVALQILRGRGELPLKALHPTGLTTVAKMVSKAWVERVGTATYRITPAGEVALKTKMPDDNKTRWK